MECVVESVQGAPDRGNDRFGVAIREGNKPPRRRTFHLAEVIPRIQQWFDGATEWGDHRRGQLARYWRSATSEGEEAMNHGENDQEVQGSAGEEAEASCTYCGRALDDSEGVSRDITCRYQSRAPTEGLCMSAACFNERNTSREST